MAADILAFLDNNRFLLVMALIAVFLIASQIVKAVRDASASRAFEESRREIAAYVAEGSISAEQATLLLSVRRKGKVLLDHNGVVIPQPDEDDDTPVDPDKRLAKAMNEGEVDEDVGRDLVNRRPSLSPPQWAHAVELVVTGMGVDEAVALARVKPGPQPAAASVPSPLRA